MIGEKDKCLASAGYSEYYHCKYTNKPCVGARFYGLNSELLSRCPMYHQTCDDVTISLVESHDGISRYDKIPNINVTPDLVEDVVASARGKLLPDIRKRQSRLERALDGGK